MDEIKLFRLRQRVWIFQSMVDITTMLLFDIGFSFAFCFFSYFISFFPFNANMTSSLLNGLRFIRQWFIRILIALLNETTDTQWGNWLITPHEKTSGWLFKIPNLELGYLITVVSRPVSTKNPKNINNFQKFLPILKSSFNEYGNNLIPKYKSRWNFVF